jgi:6-phosphogluconolactonase (cycloisomerase 2 family)
VQGAATSLPNPPADIAVASESGGAFIFALTWDGKYFGARTLSTFKVDPATGSVAAVQTINYQPAGYQSNLTVHPAGEFLYVLQGGCIQAYIIDPATGHLTQSSCSPQAPSGPFVVAPPGDFAYTATNSDLNGKMLVYSVNQIDGSLALLNSLPAWEPNIALVSDPRSCTVSVGRSVYDSGLWTFLYLDH